ncbi:hypothetical protein BLX88_26510, partial [Bacillus obstructivus]
LDAAVLLLLERLVEGGGILERGGVRGQVEHAEGVGRVVEQGQQVVHPATDVALAHRQGDLLVEQGEHRHRVLHAAVDPGERHRAAAPDRVDRGVEGAQAVDAGGLHGRPAERVG